MARLEELQQGTVVKGILPNQHVTVVAVNWRRDAAVDLFYEDSTGNLGKELLFRSRESTFEIVTVGPSWKFDGDGEMFRLVSEAYRIQLAHLFDPLLALHTSDVEPYPHQITAVYEEMLPRQPLRYLLADDPGAGKTIMTGLYLKELLVRGDLKRCMIVCPGSLVEQWQSELYQCFQLPFEILTRDRIDNALVGNIFQEESLLICRLDQLSRNESIQEKLEESNWDIIVCDEAHKMSASFSGGNIRPTKRYELGQLLGKLTRHFLLLTATPHNGKEADFQLFMKLLDEDRFEGRFRDGVHAVDTSDLMRRMVKEDLLKFDGTRLFPKRDAETINYELSELEKDLYDEVTAYVRKEMNRAYQIIRGQRGNRIGFALTILQRRLASSPEAIYRSIQRRRARLEELLQEIERKPNVDLENQKELTEIPTNTEEADEFYDETPAEEVETTEEEVVARASAAGTITELRAEIQTLQRLEALANRVCQSGTDRKWEELSNLLQGESDADAAKELFDSQGHRRKLIIFTEHRDTLRYLTERIRTVNGMKDAPFGEAEVLALARDTSVEGIVESGILHARAGRVRLLSREEYPDEWDPTSDRRINTWECTQYLIKALDQGGEAEAAQLTNQLGSEQVENARALAYRLFTICERKGWTQEAIAYNRLITSWTHIQETRTSSELREAQQEFNIEESQS